MCRICSLLYPSAWHREKLSKYVVNEHQVVEYLKVKFLLPKGVPMIFQMVSFAQTDAALEEERMGQVRGDGHKGQGG